MSFQTDSTKVTNAKAFEGDSSVNNIDQDLKTETDNDISPSNKFQDNMMDPCIELDVEEDLDDEESKSPV